MAILKAPGHDRGDHRDALNAGAARLCARYGDAIFKPLDGMGGMAFFMSATATKNLSVIIETLTRHGTQTIMAQRTSAEIVDGDKRILLIGGEVVPPFAWPASR